MVRATFNNRARHESITPDGSVFLPATAHLALKLAELAYFRIIQPGVQFFCRLNWRSLAAITRCLTVVLFLPALPFYSKCRGAVMGSPGEIEAVEKGPREPVEIT